MIDRLEKLKEKSETLQRRANQASVLAANFCLNREVSDERNRLYLNNERFLASGYLTYDAVNGASGINPVCSDEILRTLSKAGDPLASKLMEHIRTNSLDRSTILYSEVPNLLFSRRITESDYFGYLFGEKPIENTLEDQKVWLSHSGDSQ